MSYGVLSAGTISHSKGEMKNVRSRNTGTGKAQQVQDTHPLPQVRKARIPRKKGCMRLMRIRKDRKDENIRLGEAARVILNGRSESQLRSSRYRSRL